MPKRNRAAERKRAERRPTTEPGYLFEPVGIVVQTEQTWAEHEEQMRPDEPASFVPLSRRFDGSRNRMTSRPQSEPAETVVPVNRAARRAAQRASKR